MTEQEKNLPTDPPHQKQAVGLPQDVIDLVVAARNALQYLYGLDGCELRALDRAVDAFSERVPYEAGDA